MKTVASLLLLITLLVPTACIQPFSETGAQHVGEVLERLDGTSASPGELEASIEEAMEKANVKGLSLTIINDNQIAYPHAFGYRWQKAFESNAAQPHDEFDSLP
jgi:CubicO group peptidase (beta-lactamase class C family)